MAAKVIPLLVQIGDTFERWTVLAEAPFRNWIRFWFCVCQCGTFKCVRDHNLKSRASRSCGCLRNEVTGQQFSTHGHTRNDSPSLIYQTWCKMKDRVLNPKNQAYPNYGGRGITICERWQGAFENFLVDMPPHPGNGYSIERKDNNGNYEPGNCVWATGIEQNNNTRRNHFITYQGQTQTLAQWERHLGFYHGCLGYRLSLGWSIERAFTTPLRPSRSHPH